jgi:hypothetical protein
MELDDKNAEIVLQSSDGKGPILHIFSYKENKIERLTAGRYSTYGLVKNPKDLNQTLILGTMTNNKLQLSYFNVKKAVYLDRSIFYCNFIILIIIRNIYRMLYYLLYIL